MEIKLELDTDKAARATVAIAASYGLGRVSKGTKYPQLAFAGHKDAAMVSNTMGGSELDKGWNTRRT